MYSQLQQHAQAQVNWKFIERDFIIDIIHNWIIYGEYVKLCDGFLVFLVYSESGRIFWNPMKYVG